MKKPTITDGGGIIQFGNQQEVPGNIRKNLEPWEQTGQRKENSDHRHNYQEVRVRITK